MRLLAPPLGMAEAREQGPPVEHDGGVGGEHEIGELGLRRQQLDHRAVRRQNAVIGRPFALGRERQRLAAIGPRGRVHPRIDAVGNGEMAGAAHQKAGARGRGRCGVFPHPVSHPLARLTANPLAPDARGKKSPPCLR
jgi:hypothetical protein